MSALVLLVAGTRPEVIKLAPVYHALRAASIGLRPLWVATGQHKALAQAALETFGITPDADLDVMRPDQSLPCLAAAVMERLDALLADLPANMVVVQGDTTTAMTVAVASHYKRIPVAHVEAGLRSFDLDQPFPEEANRRLTSVVSALHFAPTKGAAANLLREGVLSERVVITGNTVIDALLGLPSRIAGAANVPVPRLADGQRMLLVTSHRREAWGKELTEICRALLALRDAFADVVIVYPVHPNPNVRQVVMPLLGGQERIQLTEPLDYFTFVDLMRSAYLILTDSGGVQEEAPTFKVPVLVLRQVTERPEAVEQGSARIVGTETGAIIREASSLLRDFRAYELMRQRPNPFGDGRASERIVAAIGRYLLPKDRGPQELEQFAA